jgi:hypothetical protein
LLTLAVAVILPLSMLLYSNSRITAKETLRAEARGETQSIRAEMQTLRTEMNSGFKDLRNLIERNQEVLVAELARIGGRISHLEERIH